MLDFLTTVADTVVHYVHVGLVSVAVLVAAACGHPATVVAVDGSILPNTDHSVRCTRPADVTFCTDTVTGIRYMDGERVW